MARLLAALICLLWLAACGGTPPLPPAGEGPRFHEVWVVSNGWHGTLVLPRAEAVATGLLPEAEDFPEAPFLEFGWGDRVYFPAREKTLGMTLDAALVPTPAVMHLAGLAGPPEQVYPQSEIVGVRLTDTGFRNLVNALAEDFERPGEGRATAVAPGLTPGSHFYDAKGEFHLFNTCNTWTARKLRAAGVGVVPSGVVTGDDLMERVREAVEQEVGGLRRALNRPAGTPGS